MNANLKARVVSAAGDRCEYCKSLRKYSPQPFVIDHIYPKAEGGKTIFDNLAFSCGGCNGHKYTKTHAIDPISGKLIPLFHPRKEAWKDHFHWSIDLTCMVGLSATGRATIVTLKLNRLELINLREITLLTGDHPPAEDIKR